MICHNNKERIKEIEKSETRMYQAEVLIKEIHQAANNEIVEASHHLDHWATESTAYLARAVKVEEALALLKSKIENIECFGDPSKEVIKNHVLMLFEETP